jgi:hypothetical protein
MREFLIDERDRDPADDRVRRGRDGADEARAGPDRDLRGDRAGARDGGLYGVLSAIVRQRTAEIGVRMAFGAGHTRIFRMMVTEGLRLSAAGLAVGLIAAFALTGMMQSMLVGVTPTDPATFAAMGAGFLVTPRSRAACPRFAHRDSIQWSRCATSRRSAVGGSVCG